MSRHLRDGKVEDLAGNSELAILSAGMELLGGKMGIGSMKGISGSLFGGKKDYEEADMPFDDNDDEEVEDYEDSEDEEGGYDFDNDEADDEDEDEGGTDEQYGVDGGDAASWVMGAAGGAMLGRLATRRKRFLCDIHHVRLTNLANRRRDVLVIFTLGARPGEGEGVDADSTEAAGGTVGGDGGASGSAASSSDRSKSKGGRLRSLRRARRSKRGGQADGTGSTSKPLVFKTDVAGKVERGKTCDLRRTFHGAWRGKYKDLSTCVLRMTLVEQARFGNVRTRMHPLPSPRPPCARSTRRSPSWRVPTPRACCLPARAARAAVHVAPDRCTMSHSPCSNPYARPRSLAAGGDWHSRGEPARARDGFRTAGDHL